MTSKSSTPLARRGFSAAPHSNNSDVYYIVFDVGNTSIKGGLFDRCGKLVSEGALNFHTIWQISGVAEQKPEDWWLALVSIIGTLMTAVRDRPVAAIGIRSQVNSHVFVHGYRAPYQFLQHPSSVFQAWRPNAGRGVLPDAAKAA